VNDHCLRLKHDAYKLSSVIRGLQQGNNMNQAPDTTALENLARETNATLTEVKALFERECHALAAGATVTNFVTLLAVRRVRHQLLHSTSHH
jgi:hypothetical protein